MASLAHEPEKIWSGTVSELRDFGAFVDIGGVEGLVHVSELTHGRVNKSSNVVSKGDKVKVKVLTFEGLFLAVLDFLRIFVVFLRFIKTHYS